MQLTQEPPVEHWERVQTIMRQAGILRCGVCSFSEALPLLECRAAQRLPAQAASILMGLFPYYVGDFPGRNIARYAVVQDYHLIARAMLQHAADQLAEQYPGYTFAVFVDSSPIREVSAAVRAGLGMAGRNGLLLTAEYGSYCFLGEIVTDLRLPVTPPSEGRLPPVYCRTCSRCVDACPGKAIQPDGSIALPRCRSHITQKKGPLEAWEQDAVRQGGLIWGCDICTDVCPHNQHIPITPIEAFRTQMIPTVQADELRTLCKTRAFGFRGAAVLERNLAIIKDTREESVHPVETGE